MLSDHSQGIVAPGWTFAIVSVALFMVVLDNLVVTTALPSSAPTSARRSSRWSGRSTRTRSTYAVLLLTGAALGDRFGRRRMFVIGLALFTVASAAAALAPTTAALIAARAIQGVGAAIVTPLTLTLLAEAFPAEKRGLAIGAWSGISGLGVALGPLVGGAVVDGISWHWIFWINVPIGLALLPLAAPPADREPRPRALSSTCRGLGARQRRPARASSTASSAAPSSAGRAPPVLGSLIAGARAGGRVPGLGGAHARSRCCRCGSSARAASRRQRRRRFAMYFGVFGSIFLLAQFFQVTQGYSPLEAGLRTLPWTVMPMFVAPIAGHAVGPDRLAAADGDRAWRCRPARSAGWRSISTPTCRTRAGDPVHHGRHRHGARVRPAANAVLGAVRPEEAGQASGATNAIRELGGVLGVAVLATVFAAQRLVRVAAGVHRRHDQRDLGRRRGARGRRARRAARARARRARR